MRPATRCNRRHGRRRHRRHGRRKRDASGRICCKCGTSPMSRWGGLRGWSFSGGGSRHRCSRHRCSRHLRRWLRCHNSGRRRTRRSRAIRARLLLPWW
jgi:hypothetical protein